MEDLDTSAIVTRRKIRYALSIGNLDGVKRLAKFVGAFRETNEYDIFDACQQQRLMSYYVPKPTEK